MTAKTAGVLREVYSGIGGTTVADLTNNVNFPNNPSTQEVLAVFEAPTDVAEDYGQRLTAYVVAPAMLDEGKWCALVVAGQPCYPGGCEEEEAGAT